MINENNRGEQPPRAENTEYTSYDPFSNFEEGGAAGERENRSLGEMQRPSPETVRTGEKLLEEDIYDKVTSVYEKIFERIPQEERVGVPQGANRAAKALFVKDFFRNNPSRREPMIEGLEDNYKEEYFRVVDLGEIRGGLRQGEMKVETSFLLYNYLQQKYNSLVVEQQQGGGSSDNRTDGEVNQLFLALTDLAEKLVLEEETVNERVTGQMGESREDYINSRNQIVDNLREGKQRTQDAVIKKMWDELSEEERVRYNDVGDLAREKIGGIREALMGVPVNLSEANAYALLRRFKTEDICIKKGFFGGVKNIKMGHRLIPAEEFAKFIDTETKAFSREVQGTTDKIIGDHWDSIFKEGQKREVLNAFSSISPEDVRKACNKLRKERMRVFLENELAQSRASEDVESAKERYNRPDDWADVLGLVDNLSKRSFSGKLEDDAREMLMALKTSNVIDRDYLDEEDMVELVKNKGGKNLSERIYENANSRRDKVAYIFQLIDFLSNENAQTERNMGDFTDFLTELQDRGVTDAIADIEDIGELYEREKPECLAKMVNSIQALNKLREKGVLSGDFNKDGKAIFLAFKKENFFGRRSFLNGEKDFAKFLQKAEREGKIESGNYKQSVREKIDFYSFAIKLIKLIEEEQ